MYAIKLVDETWQILFFRFGLGVVTFIILCHSAETFKQVAKPILAPRVMLIESGGDILKALKGGK